MSQGRDETRGFRNTEILLRRGADRQFHAIQCDRRELLSHEYILISRLPRPSPDVVKQSKLKIGNSEKIENDLTDL